MLGTKAYVDILLLISCMSEHDSPLVPNLKFNVLFFPIIHWCFSILKCVWAFTQLSYSVSYCTTVSSADITALVSILVLIPAGIEFHVLYCMLAQLLSVE